MQQAVFQKRDSGNGPARPQRHQKAGEKRAPRNDQGTGLTGLMLAMQVSVHKA
ncbi:MAG: hypothetical protein V4646_13825 [Pseudomonadota bacterium]